MKTQLINYGSQKLLLINGTAHKLNSETARKWAENWFSENWAKVKIIGGTIHLPSLSIIEKSMADYFHFSDYENKRNVLATIEINKSLHSLGLIF